MKVFFKGELAVEYGALGVALQPGVNDVGDDVGTRLLTFDTCRRPTARETRAWEEAQEAKRKELEAEEAAAAAAKATSEPVPDVAGDEPLTEAPTGGDSTEQQ